MTGARLAVLVRIALGAVFLYAGVIKAFDPQGFAEDIANYQLLPGTLVPLAAAALPFVEIAAAVALIVGRWSRGASLLVGGMMAVFTVALLQAFARGIDLNCGCFGDAAPADWTTLVRDVVLLGAAAFVYRFDAGRFWPRRSLAS
ncbi:MauE/DoxX family redox-associated membrane protein [Vulgatibacter sp.]|uniref:MauE/DoxX family redox-associated membrane protein n=1 Tax=Vulgatibacter sp. TaxID=1971226 RepID=UPI0035679741